MGNRITEAAKRAMGFTGEVKPLPPLDPLIEVCNLKNGIDKDKKEKKEYHIDTVISGTGVYCVAYIYPRIGDPLIIKGKIKGVVAHLDSVQLSYLRPFIAHVRKYPKKISSIIPEHKKGEDIDFYFVGIDRRYNISIINAVTGHYRIEVTDDRDIILFEKDIRRVPRSWIKELDPYIEENNEVSRTTRDSRDSMAWIIEENNEDDIDGLSEVSDNQRDLTRVIRER